MSMGASSSSARPSASSCKVIPSRPTQVPTAVSAVGAQPLSTTPTPRSTAIVSDRRVIRTWYVSADVAGGLHLPQLFLEVAELVAQAGSELELELSGGLQHLVVEV